MVNWRNEEAVNEAGMMDKASQRQKDYGF